MLQEKKLEKIEVQEIPLELLKPNPYEIRKKVDDVESLAKSIEKRGLQNPISVVKSDNFYYIVHGHRRTYAFSFLKRKTIPAIVRKESSPEDLMLDLAVENLQRKDLTPAEIGATLEQLFYTMPSVDHKTNNVLSLINQVKLYTKSEKVGGGFDELDIIKAKDILDLVGLSVSSAFMYVRLRLLPEDIQQNIVKSKVAVTKGKIGVKSGYELTRITNPEVQKEVAEKIMRGGTTHAQIRQVVGQIIVDDSTLGRKSSTGSAGKKTEYDVATTKLIEELNLLSARVNVFRSRLPIPQTGFEEIEWRAGMERMKKACMDMVKNINNVLHEELKINELLEYVNSDLEVTVNKELRFSVPDKTAEILGLKEGDIMLLKIEGIKKIPAKLIG